MDNEIRLIIFDADGTLVDRQSGQLLPGVENELALIRRARNMPLIAIATNQGGPACRDAGWGEHFPSLAQVEERYGVLSSRCGANLYMSLLYVDRDGGQYLPIGLAEDDPRARAAWRKPSPGMILAAMEDAGVSPDQTLMVGDRPEDQQAAAAAGCYFQWAQKFFARGWAEGEDYGLGC